jgi:hypothetical protein
MDPTSREFLSASRRSEDHHVLTHLRGEGDLISKFPDHRTLAHDSIDVRLAEVEDRLRRKETKGVENHSTTRDEQEKRFPNQNRLAGGKIRLIPWTEIPGAIEYHARATRADDA